MHRRLGNKKYYKSNNNNKICNINIGMSYPLSCIYLDYSKDSIWFWTTRTLYFQIYTLKFSGNRNNFLCSSQMRRHSLKGLSLRKIHSFPPQQALLPFTYIERSPLLSGGWKAKSCSDALHYLLSRQTRASDRILLHPVLFFPALKDYQNDKYALVSCCFQNPSFGK